MTIVHVQYAAPEIDGTLRTDILVTHNWTPTRRRVSNVSPDTIVVPIGFRMALQEGRNSINVAHTGTDWVWRVDEHIHGLGNRVTYVAVPDVGEINFTELTPINPNTLDPLATPEPIWFVKMEERLGGFLTSVELTNRVAVLMDDQITDPQSLLRQTLDEIYLSSLVDGGTP